jgi:hypothetical protein
MSVGPTTRVVDFRSSHSRRLSCAQPPVRPLLRPRRLMTIALFQNFRDFQRMNTFPAEGIFVLVGKIVEQHTCSKAQKMASGVTRASSRGCSYALSNVWPRA